MMITFLIGYRFWLHICKASVITRDLQLACSSLCNVKVKLLKISGINSSKITLTGTIPSLTAFKSSN